MTAFVLCCCLATSTAPAAGAPSPPAIVVFAESPDYRALVGPERKYLGVIERTSSRAGGFSYRLVTQEAGSGRFFQNLHSEGKAHQIEPMLGKLVYVYGKTNAGEFWPAHIEPFPDLNKRSGKSGILASTYWTADNPVGRREGRFVVYRDGRELARWLRVRGETAEQTASQMMAQQLRVPAIDWKKHMLISVHAGLGRDRGRVVLTRAVVRQDELIVTYTLSPAKDRDAINLTSHVVLVPRFEGPVRFIGEGVAASLRLGPRMRNRQP